MRNILITGGDHEDRIKYATQHALRLLCNSGDDACNACSNCSRILSNTHPNVIFIEPNTDVTKENVRAKNGVIKIDQIRDVVISNNKANFEPGVSVFIITQMHRATTSAANALLKVLEEHKHDKIIIALAPTRASVLATIASRLVSETVAPNLSTFHENNAELQQKILAISKARLTTRFSFCEGFSNERDTLITELEEISHECHVMVRAKKMSPLFILKLRDALERAELALRINQNPRLVTERLILREWPSLVA